MMSNVVFQLSQTYNTHPEVHNIASPLVPFNYACTKWGLIHRDGESSVIRPLLYLQATTAGQLWFHKLDILGHAFMIPNEEGN